MDAPHPTAESTQGPKRGPSSPEALAARRANLEKAWAANRTLPYRETDRRRAASRANLQKAIAARRSPQGNARARLNAVKHGLFAQRLEDSVAQLGEDHAELGRHWLLFARAFVPADEIEGRIIRRLADLCWRRLRLFRAQARWETDRLHALLAVAAPAATLDAAHTERRAYALVQALNHWEPLLREGNKLESGIERQLRALLRIRSGGAIRFRAFSPRREDRQSKDEQFLDWLRSVFIASHHARAISEGGS
jgi:hypothetical protein